MDCLLVETPRLPDLDRCNNMKLRRGTIYGPNNLLITITPELTGLPF